ncbi:hypothetical protein BDZ89DRAFT_1152719 [Hymenopellis radicata]|nr:hypothetical protein BDZ89DRAFT_1152719 [Hymenopellis radicata]
MDRHLPVAINHLLDTLANIEEQYAGSGFYSSALRRALEAGTNGRRLSDVCQPLHASDTNEHISRLQCCLNDLRAEHVLLRAAYDVAQDELNNFNNAAQSKFANHCFAESNLRTCQYCHTAPALTALGQERGWTLEEEKENMMNLEYPESEVGEGEIAQPDGMCKVTIESN